MPVSSSMEYRFYLVTEDKVEFKLNISHLPKNFFAVFLCTERYYERKSEYFENNSIFEFQVNYWFSLNYSIDFIEFYRYL